MMILHTHEQIAQRAYEIFLRNGRQPDQDLKNWLQAEEELRRELASPTDCLVAATVKPLTTVQPDARKKLAPRRKTTRRA